MSRLACGVAVLGGGPGGYSAALRCASHGLDTILIEAEALGGTCLNTGCIPSKALIHAAQTFDGLRGDALGPLGIEASEPRIDLSKTRAWKRSVVAHLRRGVGGLLRRAGVRVLQGRGEIIDAHALIVRDDGGETSVTPEHLVLATGSRPLELPGLAFGGPVLSSTDVFELEALPERLVVVGAGYIGLELGTAIAKLGHRVTVVELADRILPHFDAILVRPVAARLEELGVEVLLGSRVIERTAKGVRVTSEADGGRELAADAVLVAAGRLPVVDGYGLDRLGLGRAGPFVAIDDRCRTSVPGVFAIGDLTGEPMLAHRAIAQANIAGDVIAGCDRRWDHHSVPAVCFTDPEIFSVGRTARAAGRKEKGPGVLVGQASLAANGRARTLGEARGLLRVVADAGDHRLLGVEGVGPQVSEVAAACGLAVEMEASLEDLAATIVAHPTIAEALSDAVADALARRGDEWRHQDGPSLHEGASADGASGR